VQVTSDTHIREGRV